jgi:hypothetical protein
MIGPRCLTLWTLLIVAGLFMTGCGEADPSVKVTGSVSKGGAGVAGVTVSFIDTKKVQGGNARGAITDASGKFELKALPGKYSVLLSKKVDSTGNVPGPDVDIGQLEAGGQLHESIPPQYIDPATTPLSADVPEKGGELQPFAIEGG